MANVTVSVGSPIQLYFTSTAGKTVFPDTLVLKNGTPVASPTYSVTEVASGVYCFTYTPTSTGAYAVYSTGQVIGYVEVVSRTMYSYLRNIEDEALGSWMWDKVAGTLTLLRQDGTSLAKFNVSDSSTVSSKELV